MPNKSSYEVLKTKTVEIEKEMPTEITVKVLAFSTGAYARVPKQWVGKRIKCTLED